MFSDCQCDMLVCGHISCHHVIVRSVHGRHYQACIGRKHVRTIYSHIKNCLGHVYSLGHICLCNRIWRYGWSHCILVLITRIFSQSSRSLFHSYYIEQNDTNRLYAFASKIYQQCLFRLQLSSNFQTKQIAKKNLSVHR